jgi:site-specific recombinase XerD
MLEHFLEQCRSSGIGAHLDGFAGRLEAEGYALRTARGHLHTAAHLGSFVQTRGRTLGSLDEKTLGEFRQHLPRCRCPQSGGGVGRSALDGARLFLEYLRDVGVVDVAHDKEDKAPPLVESFRHWLEQQCGYAESTLVLYCRGAAQLVSSLGDDPSQYDARGLRAFTVERARRLGQGATQALIKALRAFLRYLAIEGKCRAGLDRAIPSVCGWRLSSLPRSLSSCDLENTVETCEIETRQGTRNRAILLLLSRLGLRASDVAGLGLADFDWEDGAVLVSGKSRRQARLPLPQEVGDAVLQYLEYRPDSDTDRVFIRLRAPLGPLGARAVSAVAARAMRRAGVSAPSYGSHILRHTAATQMLRQGVPLDEVRTILRHRSLDMTATYAKVDLELLRAVTQPWPEVLR